MKNKDLLINRHCNGSGRKKIIQIMELENLFLYLHILLALIKPFDCLLSEFPRCCDYVPNT